MIESANSVEFGLCAVVWSRDVSRIHRVARKLKVDSYFAHTGKNYELVLVLFFRLALFGLTVG